ncbi:MAG: hypothetical protein QXX12_06550 [Nanopusillaceae archaeon]
MKEECIIETWGDIENMIKYLRSSLIVELKYVQRHEHKKKLIEIIEIMNALVYAIRQYKELLKRDLYADQSD